MNSAMDHARLWISPAICDMVSACPLSLCDSWFADWVSSAVSSVLISVARRWRRNLDPVSVSQVLISKPPSVGLNANEWLRVVTMAWPRLAVGQCAQSKSISSALSYTMSQRHSRWILAGAFQFCRPSFILIVYVWDFRLGRVLTSMPEPV